ncbi:MAG: hypothetical protein K5880_14605 [Hydrogenophaga sp.]|uniref:hypothetical protein n=1 Tax=Hydrogenophaga sp. TaxID=1904254 RepID=UPI0026220C6B|nr:hypothetical protein [Hydrogenophaga sp.]MCV0439847.1 hypothetical protein [Hydrogenophaga sp.]
MSNEQVVVRQGGIGFGGLLAVLFIGLKLGGIIDWSWLWVLSPLWIPLAIVLGIFLVIAVIAGIVACVGAIGSKKTGIRQRTGIRRRNR